MVYRQTQLQSTLFLLLVVIAAGICTQPTYLLIHQTGSLRQNWWRKQNFSNTSQNNRHQSHMNWFLSLSSTYSETQPNKLYKQQQPYAAHERIRTMNKMYKGLWTNTKKESKKERRPGQMQAPDLRTSVFRSVMTCSLLGLTDNSGDDASVPFTATSLSLAVTVQHVASPVSSLTEPHQMQPEVCADVSNTQGVWQSVLRASRFNSFIVIIQVYTHIPDILR